MQTVRSDERHVTCKVHAKPEHRDEVRRILEECVAVSRREPGCLYYDLYQLRDRPDTFLLIDGWASDEAVASHLAEPDIIRIMTDLEALVSGPQELTISERLTDAA